MIYLSISYSKEHRAWHVTDGEVVVGSFGTLYEAERFAIAESIERERKAAS